MEPGEYSFTMYQGATWRRQLTLKIDNAVVDLSSHHARMDIRRISDGVVLLSLSDPSSGIVLDEASPNIVVEITPAQSSLLDFEFADYLLELVSPDGLTVDPLVKGRITLSKETTI